MSQWAVRMMMLRFGLASCETTIGGRVMTATTDKIFGRVKQALGAITGDKKMKRKGQVQEDKGELKDKAKTTIDKAQDSLADLKKRVDRS